MLKQFVQFIVLFITLTTSVATTVSAQSFQRLEIRIPFSFILNGQTLPAGKYVVERTDPGRPNILTLKNVDGGIVRFVLTQRVEKENPSPASSLIFIQREEKCYLFQVWTAGSMNGSQIPFPDAKALASKVRNHSWTQSVQGAVATWSTMGVKNRQEYCMLRLCPKSQEICLDRVRTGSDSDLVSDQHAIFPKDLDSHGLTRSLPLPVLTWSKQRF